MPKTMLQKPEAGQSMRHTVKHGDICVLGFEPNDATWVRNGNHMEINFDDGSTLVLVSFVQAIKGGGLHFELEDGNIVSGRDLLEAVSSEIDLVTG